MLLRLMIYIEGAWRFWHDTGSSSSVVQVSENARRDLKDGLVLYATENNAGLRNAWNTIQSEVGTHTHTLTHSLAHSLTHSLTHSCSPVAVLWGGEPHGLARRPAGEGGARSLLSGPPSGLRTQRLQHRLDTGTYVCVCVRMFLCVSFKKGVGYHFLLCPTHRGHAPFCAPGLLWQSRGVARRQQTPDRNHRHVCAGHPGEYYLSDNTPTIWQILAYLWFHAKKNYLIVSLCSLGFWR